MKMLEWPQQKSEFRVEKSEYRVDKSEFRVGKREYRVKKSEYRVNDFVVGGGGAVMLVFTYFQYMYKSFKSDMPLFFFYFCKARLTWSSGPTNMVLCVKHRICMTDIHFFNGQHSGQSCFPCASHGRQHVTQEVVT